MPPRLDEELDAVSLHNQALMNMEDDPEGGFEKLQFLLQQNPCPPETFGNLLLLYSKYEHFDLAADVMAENSNLTYKSLTRVCVRAVAVEWGPGRSETETETETEREREMVRVLGGAFLLYMKGKVSLERTHTHTHTHTHSLSLSLCGACARVCSICTTFWMRQLRGRRRPRKRSAGLTTWL